MVPTFLLCDPQPVSCSSHGFKMAAAPGITPDKTEFRMREAVSSYGPLLGVKETFPRNPLNRFMLISHRPQWGNMPPVKLVTERRRELSWLTYSKPDNSSGEGDGDSFL